MLIFKVSFVGEEDQQTLKKKDRVYQNRLSVEFLQNRMINFKNNLYIYAHFVANGFCLPKLNVRKNTKTAN